MNRIFRILLLFLMPVSAMALDSQDLYRQFDFHYAVAREDIAEAERLLKEGADPNILPSDLLASELGEDYWYSFNSVMEKSPLAVALRAGNTPLVEMLLQYGADGAANRNTLEAAMDRGFPDLALESLNHLVEKNRGNLPEEYLGGDHPLIIKAARNGQGELVRFFLDHGESLSVSEDYGLDLFFTAIQGNLPGIVQRFLDQGRDVNSVSPFDQTALDMAVRWGSREVVLLLLERGVDYEADSLSRLCVYAGLFDITEKIYSDHPEVNYDYTKALWNAALQGDPEIIAYYRDRAGDEILDFQYKGRNFLHTAATGGDLSFIKDIVDSRRLDPLEVTDVASPAYTAATHSRNPEAVRYFLSLGWDPDEVSHDNTALASLVFQDDDEASLEIIRILLDAGADPLFRIDADSVRSDAPLSKALGYGKARILELFLEKEAVREYLQEGKKVSRPLFGKESTLDELIKSDYGYFHRDYLDSCRLMLETGADLGSDYSGRSRMTEMVLFRDLTLFSLFLEYADRPGVREGLQQSMILAAGMGRLRFLDMVLQTGISPDFTFKNYSPLGSAVETGMTDAVRMLLEAGADPNRRSTDNKLPLELLEENSDEIREVLISYGAEDPAALPFGAEDLILAARKGDLEKTARLIALGADVNAFGEEELVPLEIAAANGNRALAELLIENGASLNAVGDRFIHLLEKSFINRHYDMYRYLLTKGASPLEENSENSTLMYNVIRSGNFPLIEDTVNAMTPGERERIFSISLGDRGTLLHIAAFAGTYETLNFFIGLGYPVDVHSENGDTPLIDAASRGHLPMVELLLEAGADPDFRGSERNRLYTPLMAAASAGSSPCVKRLLDAGADPSVVNKNGENARDLASGAMIVSLLNEAGVKGNVDLNRALVNGVSYYDYDAVLEALEEGADPDTLWTDGYPVLLTAVSMGMSMVSEPAFLIVEALLAAGADPNARSRNGSTALFKASASFRGVELGLLLLRYGADPSLENQFGKTAYQEEPGENNSIMLRFYHAILEGNLAECRNLRAEFPDFDLNYADVWGRTLLMLAFEEEQVGIAEFLIAEGADTAIKSRIFPGYLSDIFPDDPLPEKLSRSGTITLEILARFNETGELKELLEGARGADR